MSIGACRTFVDNVAFDGGVQSVVAGIEGIAAVVQAESEVVDEYWALAGGSGVQRYIPCRLS